ncbi:MAG: GGDEF domain-containing protein [Lachnospiraceae bacterium]|nr:GGDEF domain-containing protein [Lachnospiraceae bacterium]
MNFKSVNYYGVDIDTYRECSGQIRSTNRRHIGIINVWFILNNAMFLICSLVGWFGVDRRSTSMYAVFLSAAMVFELLLLIFRGFFDRFCFLAPYISMTMLMAFGIAASVRQAYMMAAMYLVMVVLCALSYIDIFGRVAAFLILSSAAFIYSSHVNKPQSIYYQDVYNIITVLILALILHYTFQRARMAQFETFQRNLQISQELEVRSSFDALTSLLNRGRFFSIAGKVLADAHEDEYIAVCLLDLDGFKQINDTLGHQMGDKVIQIAGSTILDTVGIDLSEKWTFTERALQNGYSLAGRLGGDEFIVMIRGKKDKTAVQTLLQEVLSSLNTVDFGDLHGIHASFGVTEITKEDHDMDTVYNRADDALYQSKRAGKNKITFYDPAEGKDVANG